MNADEKDEMNQETVEWNDVPDPEEDSQEDKETDKPKQDEQNPDESEEDPSSDNENGDEDPEDFSFLNDLDKGQDEDPESGKDNDDLDTGTDKEGDPKPAEDSFSVDEFISDFADADLKQFAEDYPEEAKFVVKAAQALLKKTLGDRLDQMEDFYKTAQENYANNSAMTAQQAFETEVKKLCPDADDIMENQRKALGSWLKEQPVYLQRRFRDTSDPEEAADILNRFMQSAGKQIKRHNHSAGIYRNNGNGNGRKSRTKNDSEISWNDIPDDEVPLY